MPLPPVHWETFFPCCRGGTPARPFSGFGAIPIDAPPTRTLCRGWSGLGKKLAPQGETCEAWRAESSRPTGVMVHGRRAGQSPAPTTSQADRSKTGGRAGQSPAPTMFQADHSKTGQRAHAVRPYGGSRKSQQRRTAFCGRLTAKTHKNRHNFSRYFTAIFRKNSAL